MADHSKEEKLRSKNLKSNFYQTHRPSKVGLSKPNVKDVSRESPEKDAVKSGKHPQTMNTEQKDESALTSNKAKHDSSFDKSYGDVYNWSNEKNTEFNDGTWDIKVANVEFYNDNQPKVHPSKETKLKNSTDHSIPLRNNVRENNINNTGKVSPLNGTANDPESDLVNSYGWKDTTQHTPKQRGTEYYSTYPGGTYHHKKRKSSPTPGGAEKDEKSSPAFNSEVSANNKVTPLPLYNSTKQTQNRSEVQKLKENSNIDETGEKARLLAVRKLDTPELRRKNDLIEGNSESSSTISDSLDSKTDVFLPKRYILAIMMFMGFMNMYAIRVNLNVAIGAMTNNHTISQGGFAVTMVIFLNYFLFVGFVASFAPTLIEL